MKRKALQILLALAIAGPGLAQVNLGPANPAPQPGAQDPYRSLTPLGDPVIPGEETMVLYFHSADCPYCRALEHDLHQWAATLPTSVTFLPIPLATEETIGLARAYYVGKLCADAATFHDYAEGLYAVVQDRSPGFRGRVAFEHLAEEVGMEPGCIARYWSDQRVAAAIVDAYAMLQRYQVDRVPTLVIFSRYAVSPDNTGGSLDLLLKLASGLISRHLRPDEGMGS